MFKVIDSAVPVACWSCSVAHNDATLFCPHCSKIQPPPGGDYFSVFGIVPRLDLDLSELEHEFHRLSRKLHPDRFARAGDHEKQWSLADTALLNDAYRTLKDPIRRTEYLLKLHGAEIGEEHAGKNRPENEKDPSRVPADLLEEVFDLNMQLEEMRMDRKMGEENSQLQASLEQAKRKFDGLQDEVDQDLRAQWQAWDEGDAAARKAAQKTMVALLDRRRYLSNLVRDVTEVLGA
ncbi:MAG: Fe-S protein assembly co-chaperone HscB [Terracidiphilus sp.]|jgi:molecular chaperone HscB